jgi:hypothetical protein
MNACGLSPARLATLNVAREQRAVANRGMCINEEVGQHVALATTSSPVAQTGLPPPEKSQVEERRPASTRPDSMIVATTSKPGVDTVVAFGTLVVPKT